MAQLACVCLVQVGMAPVMCVASQVHVYMQVGVEPWICVWSIMCMCVHVCVCVYEHGIVGFNVRSGHN